MVNLTDRSQAVISPIDAQNQLEFVSYEKDENLWDLLIKDGDKFSLMSVFVNKYEPVSILETILSNWIFVFAIAIIVVFFWQWWNKKKWDAEVPQKKQMSEKEAQLE